MKPTPVDPSNSSRRAMALTLSALVVVLLLLFGGSLRPGWLLFSNDGPYGISSSAYYETPGIFAAIYQDLNWVGGYVGAASPNLSNVLLWLLKPLWFAKLYAPLSLLVVGLSAAFLFRRLGFHPAVSCLGGLAAALNTDLFSHACWGLGTHALSVGAMFLALAALFPPGGGVRWWIRLAVCGLAVGWSVMEGFDSGAILSLFLAAAVVFQAIGDQRSGARFAQGFGRVALVAVLAGFMAFHTLSMLIGTQIQGVAGMQQDPATRAQRWQEATRWSLPKIETFRLLVPGLYGYRMETPEGGNYWGGVGRDPAWDAYLASPSPDPAQAPHPVGLRHSGTGFYAGLFVLLLGAFAVAQAAQGRNSVLTGEQRRWVWFWSGAAVISLLLSFGRHAPFYQIIYALPYFSTMRNPIKFLHPLSLSLILLFGYGLQAAWLRIAQGVDSGAWSWSGWWGKAKGFDRRWVLGCGTACLAALVGWMIYASSQSNLARHLAAVGFPSPDLARAIAGFSAREVGWSVLFLGLACGWLGLALSGFFRGPRATLVAAATAGLVLVGDLARADRPWIVFVNYREEYASNPVIDFLRERPFEQRVTGLFLNAGPEANQAMMALQQVYAQEWMQRLFPHYNVQSLDIVQEPRPTEENLRYRAAFVSANPAEAIARRFRQWELTSTRHILTLSGLVDGINQELDQGRNRFRLSLPFGLMQERADGPILAVTNAVGPFGVLEFTGALPKASLYSQWEVVTDPEAVLQRLVDPAFTPGDRVVLDQDPWPGTAPSTNTAPGSVSFEEYHPKHLRLAVEAAVPAVLLLNDNYHPDWEVSLDGQPVPQLRANYLMRGVAVPAGNHTVEFRFRPPIKGLLVSLAAIALALVLCGLLAIRQGIPRR